MRAAVATYSKAADEQDQQWLDERVTALVTHIEDAKVVAADIQANWFPGEGREVGRLHPGMTPGKYIDSLGHSLSLTEALAVMPEASSREVAKVAKVHHSTVAEARKKSVGNPTDMVRRSDTGTRVPARRVPRVAAPGTITPKQTREVIAKLKDQFARNPGEGIVVATIQEEWADYVQSIIDYCTAHFVGESDEAVSKQARALVAYLGREAVAAKD